MKKNYFKFLAVIAMMLLTGVSFTSCDDVINALDNPVAPPSETPAAETVIEQTAKGAKVTINNLSDISAFIDEIKKEVEEFQKKNPGKEFVLDIETPSALETTDADFTLLIPDLSEFNIVINVNADIDTNGKPLTLKLDQKASTRGDEIPEIKTNFDNQITLNFKNENVDLILDVPGTTVYVNKLNSIQILNGVSVVRDGGSIKTYVWAPVSNDYEMNNGEPEWVKFSWTMDGSTNESYIPNVRNHNDGNAYIFKNLKIVKGKADYARIGVWDQSRTLDKLTIAEGVTVVSNYYCPYIKEIVGEGTGGILKSQSVWWSNEEKKEAASDFGFDVTNKISNVAIEPFLEGEFKDATIIRSDLNNAPSDIENSTIKYSRVNFRDPQSSSASVKNCKFEGNGDEKRVSIIIPAQTQKVNGYKFSFENCEFPKDCKFQNSFSTERPVLDEKGNQVYKDIYCWIDFDNGQWYGSESLDGVPAAKKEVGQTESYWVDDDYSKGYWIEKQPVYEDATYKDYYAYISFTSCKIGGAAFTSEKLLMDSAFSPAGAYLRFEFDGKTYRAISIYDPEVGKTAWVLIEA